MHQRQMTIKFLRAGKFNTEPARGIKAKVITVKEGKEYTGTYVFGLAMIDAEAAEEVIPEKSNTENEPSEIELFLQSIVKNADDDKGAREALGYWAEKEHGIDIDKRNGIPKIIESIIKEIKNDKDSE